ncbi:hypothetical protein VQL36_10180 [Chengkuizengella sp. SCS-71B]|uniref:hypothetical protein n=1 Tax=Chengkuizengella sp. SCS-71B TaxID=3115290 RepID=UPI0032C23B59
MSFLFNSMPLPLYLLIAWGGAIGLSTYFLKNTHKYNKIMLLGILLLSSSSFFVGILRIISSLELFQKYKEKIEILAILGFLGIPFFMIGSYIQVKDDPEKRKIVIFGLGLLILACITFTISVAIAFLGK